MANKTSERRLAENQTVFRSFNEQVQQGIDAVNRIAAEENDQPISLDPHSPLYFYCECSDETCKKRIRISPDDFNRIHQSRDKFTIACGHDVKGVEDVTEVHDDYSVVTKRNGPPPTADALQPTDLNYL